jgi:hypothetical protein
MNKMSWVLIAAGWLVCYNLVDALADRIFGEYIRSGGEKQWWYLGQEVSAEEIYQSLKLEEDYS